MQPPLRPFRRAQWRGAFTLLEILVVLALIGLLAGVTVTGVGRMLNPGPDSPVQAFWHAANAARRHALREETEVRLSFDKAGSQLLAVAHDGAELPAFAVPEGTDIVFIPGLIPGTSAISGSNRTVSNLFDGALSTGAAPLDYISFYPDGTCSLFRVQIQLGGGGTFGSTGGTTIQVDPWTCTPMLTSQNTGEGG